jgi:hypothetical protein
MRATARIVKAETLLPPPPPPPPPPRLVPDVANEDDDEADGIMVVGRVEEGHWHCWFRASTDKWVGREEASWVRDGDQ